MPKIGENIARYRKMRGMTQEELASRMGYKSKSTINKIELGINDVVQSNVVRFAEVLGTTPARLMGWDEELPVGQYGNILPVAAKRIPMLGKIACGKPIYADEERESYVEAGTNIQADFCLRAAGDSMTGARIYDGDIVFIRAQDSVDNGEVAAVVISDEATLKRVYYYPDKQKLVLQAENARYEPLVFVGDELNDVHILGKAIAFQSDVR